MKKLLKHGIFALSAALFVTAFLTSCPPPVGEVPPAGNVRFVVDGDDLLPRTIIPVTPATSVFLSFRLAFAVAPGVVGNTAVVPTGSPFNVGGGVAGVQAFSTTLVPGTYTMTTTAFLGNGQTLPAATATNTVVITEGGTTTTVAIVLSANAPDPTNGEGKFGWNINLSGITTGTLSTATMAIVPLNGGTDTWDGTGTNTPVNLLTAGNANTIALPYTLDAGYYDVIFDLATTTPPATARFQQVLHVYANFTSEFVHSFNNTNFGIMAYTVTFRSWNYTTSTSSIVDTASVTPGTAIGAGNIPGAQTQSGYTFLGWYTLDGHASGGANVANWGIPVTGTTEPTGDMNAYARWLKDGELNGVTGITLTPIGGTSIVVWNSSGSPAAAVAEGQTITVSSSGTLALIVQNASDFNDGTDPTIDWIHNSTNVATKANGITFTTGGAGILDTDNPGVYVIVVRAVTATGVYQSSYFTVVVQ